LGELKGYGMGTHTKIKRKNRFTSKDFTYYGFSEIRYTVRLGDLKGAAV